MEKKIKVGVVGAGAISDIYIQNMMNYLQMMKELYKEKIFIKMIITI